MVDKKAYGIFLYKVRAGVDHPIRTFFYDWDEFLDDTQGMYVYMAEKDFKKQGFATHAKGNK